MTREDVFKSLLDIAEFIINNSDNDENAIDVSLPSSDDRFCLNIHYEFWFSEVDNA